MKIFRKILANKFLVIGIAFLVWMLFFDRNDIPRQINRMQKLHTLENRKQDLNERIAQAKNELHLLKTSPETLEKYARERFLMKKENEDLFLVITDSSLVN